MSAVSTVAILITGYIVFVCGLHCPVCSHQNGVNVCHDHPHHCHNGQTCGIHVQYGLIQSSECVPSDICHHVMRNKPCTFGVTSHDSCTHCCSSTDCANSFIGPVANHRGVTSTQLTGFVCPVCDHVSDASHCTLSHCPSEMRCLFHLENGRLSSRCGSQEDCSNGKHHWHRCDDTLTLQRGSCFDCCHHNTTCVNAMLRKLSSKVTVVPTSASTPSPPPPGMFCPVCHHTHSPEECFNTLQVQQCKSGDACMFHHRTGNLTVQCTDAQTCVQKIITHPPCQIAIHQPGKGCFACCYDENCLTQEMKIFTDHFMQPMVSKIPVPSPTAKFIVTTPQATTPKTILTQKPTTSTQTTTTPSQKTTPGMQPATGVLCPACDHKQSAEECFNTPNKQQCNSGDVCMFHHEPGNLTIACTDARTCIQKVSTHLPCQVAIHHSGMGCFACCNDDNCLQQERKIFTLHFILPMMSSTPALQTKMPASTPPTLTQATITTSQKTTTTQQPTTTTQKPKTATQQPTTTIHQQTTTKQATSKTQKPTTTTQQPTTTTQKPTTTKHQTTTTQQQTTTTQQLTTTTQRTSTRTLTATPGTQLCPFCTNHFSTDSCNRNLQRCDASHQVCEITMKDRLFSSKCVDRHTCEKRSMGGTLHNCALHGYSQNDNCTRCCSDDACISATMAGLEKERNQRIGNSAICPHCMFTTDLSICTQNFRTCLEPSGHEQGCHVMKHENGTFSAGCSYGLPNCKYDIEVQNSKTCQVVGFPVNVTCHFCCNNKTCVAEILKMENQAPPSTLPPITTSQAMHTQTVQRNESTTPETTTQATTTTTFQRNASTSPPDTITKLIPTTTAPRKPSIKCYECDSDEFTCEYDYHQTQCYSPNDYCINHLKNNRDGTRSIIKRCGTLAECQRDWWLTYSDDDKCTRFNSNYLSTNSFECKYCCTTPLCNLDINPEKSTLYAVTSTK